MKNIDDRTRFFPNYKVHLTTYVLVCCSCGIATGLQRLSELQMFQIPSMVTLSIAATRIYRSLADHATGCTEVYESV